MGRVKRDTRDACAIPQTLARLQGHPRYEETVTAFDNPCGASEGSTCARRVRQLDVTDGASGIDAAIVMKKHGLADAKRKAVGDKRRELDLEPLVRL